LPLFADVEVIYTLYSAMKKLDIGDFVIHMNNKKFLSGFLLSLEIDAESIASIISVIDKKDKMPREKLTTLFTAK
jgi:histidyl-tRNA synthetase